jgi:hypothetical protein
MRTLLLAVLAGLLMLGGCSKKGKNCSDGIKNNGEVTVDCGGPCPGCGTCSDGVKNQDETSVDCGGVCSPCPTCSDGIQNQNEAGIDCGGPCAACPAITNFPDTGFYGRNILRQIQHDTIDADSSYSFAAIIGTGVTLHIRLRELGNSVSWGINEYGGGWHNSIAFNNASHQDFYAIGPLYADRRISAWMGTGTGRNFVAEYYLNNSATPFYTKSVFWR